MSQSEETEYTVRNYEALDNQVAQMAAREAEETRRLQYLNFFRLAQVFAIACLALGLFFVLAGWGIKMARSYKQEIIYKGSQIDRPHEQIDAPEYYSSQGDGRSFEQITLSETERVKIETGMSDPVAATRIEEIFEEQNSVANRVDTLQGQQDEAFSRVASELEISDQSGEKLEKVIAEKPELAGLKDDIDKASAKLQELQITNAENVDLKKNSADTSGLTKERADLLDELERVDPTLADKAKVAANSAAVGDDIVEQLEAQNRELSESEIAELELDEQRQNAIAAIAAEDPELAQELSDALKASNAIESALDSSREENERIRNEQGLAPNVSEQELDAVKEALRENPKLADKVEQAITKPNTLSQEALAKDNENLRQQLQAAGRRNQNAERELADANEANNLMEKNFEAGLTDEEKEALEPITEKYPSLKNKIGAALNPEPGSVQDYANKAATANKEAQQAAGRAAAAEKRAAQAEAALEAATQESEATRQGSSGSDTLTPEEKQALDPIFRQNPELEEKIASAMNPPAGSKADLVNQAKEAAREAQQAEGRAASAEKRAEQAEEALRQAIAERPTENDEKFEAGFSQEEIAALKPILDENPALRDKLANAVEPKEGSNQDLANQVADAVGAAQKAQDEAKKAEDRAEQAEQALAKATPEDLSNLENELAKAKEDLARANRDLEQARAKVEELESERPESILPESMDELLKGLSPSEKEELEGLMAKSPDLLEALKRQAAEDARRSMNIKENVKFQNQEVASGIPGYTITTWFEFEKATDVQTASRVCSLARPNASGGGVDSFPIARQIAGNQETRPEGLLADLSDRSISEAELQLALPKCAWR